jgi:hypothetical protein
VDQFDTIRVLVVGLPVIAAYQRFRAEEIWVAVVLGDKAMPIRQVLSHADLSYFLLCYNAEGVEQTGDPDARNETLSARVAEDLISTPVTDVFLISHGWLGDVPGAIAQYDRWIGAMASCSNDRAKVRQKRPEFRALLVGLHWPSLPWGDERLDDIGTSYSATERSPLEELVNQYAERIADTPAAREALSVIFEAAMDNIAPAELSPEVREAYLVLDRESGLGCEHEGAAPGADREPFDPKRAYQSEGAEAADFGTFSLDGILSPLRQLSFWNMKDRARHFGETGGRRLLNSLQEIAASSGRALRFHLMGHSFGSIVVSAMLCGPGAKGEPGYPVDSLFLVQGALSLWSFCSSIPSTPDRSGYFRSVLANCTVKGPIVVTLSEHDTAVGKYYPLAAGLGRQVSYAPVELPKYGGLGTFGVRGPGIDATAHICRMEGPGGAHNDIAHPEIAHAFWQAVLA